MALTSVGFGDIVPIGSGPVGAPRMEMKSEL